MKNIDEICLVVQARLSSQRLPEKMIKPFAGSNLFEIALKKLGKSKVLPKSQIYSSVRDPVLVDISLGCGINVFERSEKSALSEGTPMTEIYEWWDQLPYKYCIMINACCPLLSIEAIDEFIKAYTETDSRGLFGVIEKKNYFWDINGDLITKWPEDEEVMNTKNVGITYEAAHCLYAGKMEDIGNSIWMGEFKKDDPELCTVPEEETFDIDYPWQFDVAETLYIKKFMESER